MGDGQVGIFMFQAIGPVVPAELESLGGQLGLLIKVLFERDGRKERGRDRVWLS